MGPGLTLLFLCWKLSYPCVYQQRHYSALHLCQCEQQFVLIYVPDVLPLGLPWYTIICDQIQFEFVCLEPLLIFCITEESVFIFLARISPPLPTFPPSGREKKCLFNLILFLSNFHLYGQFRMMMMMINMYEIISFQVSKKRLISVIFSFGSCYCQQSKLTLIHKFPDNASSF